MPPGARPQYVLIHRLVPGSGDAGILGRRSLVLNSTTIAEVGHAQEIVR